jgi:formylglycine-generating enzyme
MYCKFILAILLNLILVISLPCAFGQSNLSASDKQLLTIAQQQVADSSANDRAFWDSVKDSKNPDELRAYLEQFPKGIFAPLARTRLKSFEKGDVQSKSSNKEDSTGMPAPSTGTRSLASSFSDQVTGIDFVLVKGGCFQMGDSFGDGRSDEKPVHEVCVNDFYMGKYEVTQGQWREIMGNNPSKFINCGENCPVEQVSWNDAHMFIEELINRTGKQYRLPTEAEWEYAARSGGKSEKWAGTRSESSVGNHDWYIINSGGFFNGKTRPVGQKQPNGLGLYDMGGNVEEWCNDWYGNNYYANSDRQNPDGPSAGKGRVIRGGAWVSPIQYMRAASRSRSTPNDRINYRGFRLVITP